MGASGIISTIPGVPTCNVLQGDTIHQQRLEPVMLAAKKESSESSYLPGGAGLFYSCKSHYHVRRST